MDPLELSKCEVAQKLCGVIVATEEGTCRSSPGTETRIDYAILDLHLPKSLKSMALNEDCAFHPHKPAEFQFADRPAALKYLTVDSPPDIPRSRFCGPLMRLPAFREDFDKAKTEPERGERSSKKNMTTLYEHWARAAEKELARTTNTTIKLA